MFRKFQISILLPNRYSSENCRWVPLLVLKTRMTKSTRFYQYNARGGKTLQPSSFYSELLRECQRQTKRGKNRLSNAKKFYQFAIGRVNKDNSANFPRCLFLRKKNTRKKVNSNIEVIVVLVLESKGLCLISLTGRPGIKIPLFHQFDWGTKGDQCWLKLRYISRN